MSEVKLPMIENPPYKAFQIAAFYLGILMVDPLYINKFYNSYINLSVEKARNMLDMCYPKYNWYTYDDCDFFIEALVIKHNPYNIDTEDPYRHLVNLILKKLKEGFFVKGHYDEFYISCKSAYKQRHYVHDYLLCGYNEEGRYFIGLGYTATGFYEYYHVSFEEMYQSLIWSSENELVNPGHDLVRYEFLKVKPNRSYITDISLIKNELFNFLNPQHMNTDKFLYGVDAYRFYIEHMEEELDLRCVRVLMEHKKIMRSRLEHLRDKMQIGVGDFIASYKAIEREAEIQFNLAMKYTLTEDVDTKHCVVDRAKRMMETEIPMLENLYKRIETESI